MEIIIPLTITFVVLKLTHVINWSWWWVLSPLWIAGIISAIWWGVFGTTALFARLFKSETKTIRSKRRILFCVLGVVLFWLAMWQRGTSYEYYEFYEYTQHDLAADILLFLAYFFAIFGSYLWAKEKGRNWKWAAIGLLGPFGYIVLRKLKDKRVDEKETTGKALGEIETDFREIMATQDNGEKLTKVTERFCPKCGHKLSRRMIYCPNCGSKVSN